MVLDAKTSVFLFEVKQPYDPKPLLLNRYIDELFDSITLKAIKGIKNSLVVDSEEKGVQTFKVQTEGINLEAVFGLDDLVNVNKVYTNDVGSILNRYGVEACRQSIVREMNVVFKGYNIVVDFRHLFLIADYITFSGAYRSFNRVGMETASSPFLKMTYETSMQYLMRACMMKEKDNCKSASSRIICGLTPQTGTKCFELITENQ